MAKKPIKVTEVVLRDAHQSLLATRMTMDEMQDRIEAICRACRHLVIISDEVGNGVVPLQKEDRIYRDLVGNLLIGIASKAERVDRIICQIPQQIK